MYPLQIQMRNLSLIIIVWNNLMNAIYTKQKNLIECLLSKKFRYNDGKK